jgi:Mrp family chromosome partitioning ATPase
VTSAAAWDGKTTVALNLTIAEAMAGNPSVLLLEANFRRPALASRLGIESSPGLGEILSGDSTLATIETAIRRVDIPGRRGAIGAGNGFSVITAGALPPNPVELLESRTMIDVLVELTERFSIVIIDSPPTSSVPDAIPLMKLVSGIVVVSRIGASRRDAARRFRGQLDRLKVSPLGVVGNGGSPKSGEHAQDYWYSGVESSRGDVLSGSLRSADDARQPDAFR